MNEARLMAHEIARKKARARRRKQVRVYRVFGLFFIVLAIAFIAMTWNTGEDASGALLIGVFGLYLLFGRM